MAKVIRKFRNNSQIKIPAGVRSVEITARRKTRALHSFGGTIGESDSQPCAPHFIAADGLAYGMGPNNQGLIGDGTVVPKSVPTAVAGAHAFEYITSSWNSSVRQVLGLRTDGLAYVWGTFYATVPHGGGGAVAIASSPLAVLGGRRFRKVYANMGTFFGIDFLNDAYAWGGQAANAANLGVNTITATSSPTAVVGGLKVQKIVTAPPATVFLTMDNDAYVSGNGAVCGQVGSVANRSSPVLVAGGIKWADVKLSFATALGLSRDGKLYMWGDNSNGQQGAAPGFSGNSTPTLVNNQSGKYIRIMNKGATFFAQHESGKWFTWGPGPSYGYPAPPMEESAFNSTYDESDQYPQPMIGQEAGHVWKEIFFYGGGYWFQNQAGDTYAYGNNADGQAGIGSTADIESPTLMVGGQRWVKLQGFSVNLEFSDSCYGIDSEGRIWAWGFNEAFGAGGGQLGTGNMTKYSSPVLMTGARQGRAYDVTFRQTVEVVPGTTYNISVNGFYNAFGQIGIGQDCDELEVSYEK